MSSYPDPALPSGKLPGDLLHRLVTTYVSQIDDSVIVGPGRGRDAAVIDSSGALIAAKSDPITFASDNAPAFLVDINANDLACLGATPRWMLVTALLPPLRTTENDVERQFRDLATICSARGITLIGGHTEITPAVNWPILIGTLLGTVTHETLLAPGGARPGDRLLLTKGIAIEGTALLARELRDQLTVQLGARLVANAAALLDHPGISIVSDAHTLLRAGGITALHDPTEGGLATAAQELASAAGLGVVLDESTIPILPETRAVADCLGIDPLGLLASGSLLASAPQQAIGVITAACKRDNVVICDIGYLTSDSGANILRQNGSLTSLPEFSSDELTRVL